MIQNQSPIKMKTEVVCLLSLDMYTYRVHRFDVAVKEVEINCRIEQSTGIIKLCVFIFLQLSNGVYFKVQCEDEKLIYIF